MFFPGLDVIFGFRFELSENIHTMRLLVALCAAELEWMVLLLVNGMQKLMKSLFVLRECSTRNKILPYCLEAGHVQARLLFNILDLGFVRVQRVLHIREAFVPICIFPVSEFRPTTERILSHLQH